MKLILNAKTNEQISRKQMFADFKDSYEDAHGSPVAALNEDEYRDRFSMFVDILLDDEAIKIVDSNTLESPLNEFDLCELPADIK